MKERNECNLINRMYEAEFQEINGGLERDRLFDTLYCDFLTGVEVSQERKIRTEELAADEYEELKKSLVEKCPKRKECPIPLCSLDKGDCWLLNGWQKEGSVYKYSYPILGEYLRKEKKVVLYVNNIDDACGQPTYNGVLSTYIHELFHAYFHYVTDQKQAGYNYIEEIEEAMTEFSTLVLLRLLQHNDTLDGWNDIIEYAEKKIGGKQNKVGSFPAYGFGFYLFKKIPENEAFDWIKKYAERLGYIDEEDELVKQYKQMVYPVYPTEPEKCKELLRKILFETSNKPIQPREVKKSDDGMDGLVIVDYTPPYDSFGWKGQIHVEYDLSTDVFKYRNGFLGRWNLSDKDIARIKAFLRDENNLRDFFDAGKAYSAPEVFKTEHDRTYTLRIKWKGNDKTINVGFGSTIPFRHPF